MVDSPRAVEAQAVLCWLPFALAIWIFKLYADPKAVASSAWLRRGCCVHSIMPYVRHQRDQTIVTQEVRFGQLTMPLRQQCTLKTYAQGRPDGWSGAEHDCGVGDWRPAPRRDQEAVARRSASPQDLLRSGESYTSDMLVTCSRT